MKEYRNYMFSYTPRSLYLQGKSSQQILHKSLDRPHSQSGHFEEGINLLPLPGTELQSLRNPTCSLGTTPTMLPQLITVLEYCQYFIYKSKIKEK
jgi:hypothetical protein